MKSPKKLYPPVDEEHNQFHPQITYFQRHIAKLFIKIELDLQE
jgi:hypothetical protein